MRCTRSRRAHATCNRIASGSEKRKCARARTTPVIAESLRMDERIVQEDSKNREEAQGEAWRLFGE